MHYNYLSKQINIGVGRFEVNYLQIRFYFLYFTIKEHF